MFVEKWPTSLVRMLLDRCPCMADLYRSVRDQLDFTEEPKATVWGFKLAGNAAMAQGTFEPTETRLVRNILKDVDILVNVGANVGYYCCHALSMGRPVIAFEPIERNIRYLCKNIQINGWAGVEVYPVALSNSVDVLKMYGGKTGASIVKGWAGIPESYVTLVPSSTMDVVLGTRLLGKRALILVDIEGAEKWMIEGATIMLANNPKPIWVVEITTTEHQPSGVETNQNLKSTFELFFENGYQSFTFDENIRPVTMEHVELASNGSLRFATHNFIFSESRVVF
jgi:FkbM family methyltransferase